MRLIALPILLALASPAFAHTNQAATAAAVEPQPLQHAAFIMRHLQKAEGDDPELNAEGKTNAVLVARKLVDAGIKAVFVTRTRRATETGALVAKQAGIEPTRYDHRDMPGLQRAVAAVNGPVLIVGHSNTVPDLVAAFGGTKPPPLADGDYGTVWILSPGGETESYQLDAGERG